MDTGDRVALRRDPSTTGVIHGQVLDGVAYVRFDQGGAVSLAVADLIPAEDKAWPPPGMETKTPRTEVK